MSINFKWQTSTKIIDTYWIIEKKINHTFDYFLKKQKETQYSVFLFKVSLTNVKQENTPRREHMSTCDKTKLE